MEHTASHQESVGRGQESTGQESKHLDLVNHIEQAYERRRGMREAEAASYLGLSIKTLQAWRHQCRGPVYYRLGRACVYRQADLDRYMESGAVHPIGGAA